LTSRIFLQQNDFDTGKQEIISHIAPGNPDFSMSELMSVRKSAVRDQGAEDRVQGPASRLIWVRKPATGNRQPTTGNRQLIPDHFSLVQCLHSIFAVIFLSGAKNK